MDDEDGGPAAPGDERRPAPGVPPLPPEVSSEADEVRRLVEAGASSPEELRALAERIRVQRELEDAAWRREVKPALLQAKKRRPPLRELRATRDPDEPTSRSHIGVSIVALAAVLVLLLLATRSSPLLLLVPIVGVLVYAYQQGRRERSPEGDDPVG